jgi:transcriptional regulator NrdR family protein
MVCIYCGKQTEVINTRLQKRRNSIWRRRHCRACNAVFTSIEQVAYDLSLGFEDRTSRIVPFARDRLFISLYEACGHRQHASSDATDLTDTVIRKLLDNTVHNGIVKRADLIRLASDTLRTFDAAAHTHYTAYHHL